MATRPKNVVFFHPDLGIGGAERLIVDAAVGLQDLGYKVTIFTSHCDPKHCFEEARDGTLDVRVRGNTLPPSIFNRFHIVLAILRQIHLILSITFFTGELYSLKPNVFIVDQLSACVPLLRWLFPDRQRTLFYCHFPDQLLVQERNPNTALAMLKKIYRIPFDWFEGWSTSASDKIVVNSKFTRGVAKQVFSNMERDFDVIYPCVNTNSRLQREEQLWDGRYKILLSINRFERKKDIGLAIRAYAGLSPAERRGTRLVVAGGYDSRVLENVQYHDELQNMAGNAGLRAATAGTVSKALAVPPDTEVLFLLSVPESFKEDLLDFSQLLIYTPSNEHFGIVPVEAMQSCTPVLASNTGGPLETVVENETGWLRDVKDVKEWTAVIRKVLYELPLERRTIMARQAKARVKENFSREKMAFNFNEIILQMVTQPRSEFVEQKDLFMVFAMTGIFVAGIVMAIIQTIGSHRVDDRATEFARVKREQRAQAEEPKLMLS